MYKNTIGRAIEFLKEKNHDPTNILKVISLYDVPVDLYSISKMAGTNVHSTEFICDYLTTKLILEKGGENYMPNEFANKFIISKFIPNKIELKRLKEKIRTHQKELEQKLSRLEIARKRAPALNQIMEDWKPKNSIDKIAISDAYSLYGQTSEFIRTDQIDSFQIIEEEFNKIEKMSAHPYIKFQKARCMKLILDKSKYDNENHLLKKEISKYYEDAIDTTDFYYSYIKKTKSYASLNSLYGMFLVSDMNDHLKSLRYLEEAIYLYKKLNLKDKLYYTAIHYLSKAYIQMFIKEKDRIYLHELRELALEIKNAIPHLKQINFDYFKYMNMVKPILNWK